MITAKLTSHAQHNLQQILQGSLAVLTDRSWAVMVVVDLDVPLHGSGDPVRSAGMHV